MKKDKAFPTAVTGKTLRESEMINIPGQMRQQFKLITSDGVEETIAYEKQALKAYYRAKLDLLEALDMDEEDGGVTSGFVQLNIRNLDPITLKGTEWEIYQEYDVPDEDDDDEDGDDDNDQSLDNINEDSVADDDDDD